MASGTEDSDPVITDWIRLQSGGGTLEDSTADPLSKLALVVHRADHAAVPEEVLHAWHRLLMVKRRTLYQSELAFIDQAHQQGWTWKQIGERLGLAESDATEEYRAGLAAELDRIHPSNLLAPWGKQS